MILEVYTRVFVDSDKLDETINFYISLLNGEKSLHFSYPETGLELAAISSPKLSVLIISGPEERRAPFKTTSITIKVSQVEDYLPVLRGAGAQQLEPVQKTPVGHKTRVRHPDGLIVEYVDHINSHAAI